MTLASGKVAAYLYKDKVFAKDAKTPLCPLRKITRNLKITIKWTKDYCLLVFQEKPLMRLLLKKGLHYLTKTQFALIRRALQDHAEGLPEVNQLNYWTPFKGKTVKQILASNPELIAASALMRASALLMTVVQDKQGAKKFAKPKGLKSADILPTGVKNIYTVFTHKASADVEVRSVECQETDVSLLP
eukprot:2873720-Amphidinium_carterae.1